VLAEKYRVERVLGTGGVGMVVAAHHIQLDQKVAIKFLLPEALTNPEAVARFLREARTAVRIQSEHVARVSDVGQLPAGAPYMVMEYLEGGDLADWLSHRGPLPIDQAIDFVLQASVAVADAHALGIIHRDLKPANLFCVRRSDGQLTIKVLDFGISKAVDPFGTADAGLTKTSTVMGTPLYMSPEQMRSTRSVDARTDIWALGVILFELIAGKPPFEGATVMELAINVSNDVPPSLQSFRSVPAELEAVILKCLEKDLSRRYSSVRELAEALLPFAPPRARASVERISGILQPTAPSAPVLPFASGTSGDAIAGAATISSMETQGGTRPPRTALWASAGAVAAAGVAALVWLLATTTHGTQGPAAPTAVDVLSSSASASSSVSPASIPPAATIEPTPAPPPTAMVSAAPSAPPPVVVPPLKSRPTQRPPATRVVDCDPPFTLNEAGHRVHKPGCQ
jgi:serine/threonine-protein kinase